MPLNTIEGNNNLTMAEPRPVDNQSSSSSSSNVILVNNNTTTNSTLQYLQQEQEHSMGTFVLFCVLAFFFCLCAKPNVPDARYRRYPNGAPPVKKKRTIDPEKRKKLIEKSVMTKEVSGQDETGAMTLSEFRPDDDQNDGTRTLVQKFSDNTMQLFQRDDNEGLDVEGQNHVDTVAVNDVLDDDYDDNDDMTCMICLEPFHIGNKVTWSKNMKCHHIFHHECIYPWLLKNEECPCCRCLYIPRTKYDEVGSDNENNNESGDEEEEEEEEWKEEEEDPSSAYVIMNGLISRVRNQVRSSIVSSVNSMRTSSYSSSNSHDSMNENMDDTETAFPSQEETENSKISSKHRFWTRTNIFHKISTKVRRKDSCNYNTIHSSQEFACHPNVAVDNEMGILPPNSGTALNRIFRISSSSSISNNQHASSSLETSIKNR